MSAKKVSGTNTNGKVNGQPAAAPVPANKANPPIKKTPKEKNILEKIKDKIDDNIDQLVEQQGTNKLAMGAGALGKALNEVFMPTALWEIIPVGKIPKTLKKGADIIGISKKSDEAVAAAKQALKEAAEKKGKKGGKTKVKKKPDCGKRETYSKQDGDFAGAEMERDHIPSFGALKTAFEQWAKDNGHELTDIDKKTLFGETADKKRLGGGGKLGQHAQTVAVPKDVHAAGETHGSKNNKIRQSEDAGDLQKAARRDGETHKKNIKTDKHKDCAEALGKAVDEIGQINKDQYEQFFERLYNDTKSGKATRNPWKGI